MSLGTTFPDPSTGVIAVSDPEQIVFVIFEITGVFTYEVPVATFLDAKVVTTVILPDNPLVAAAVNRT